MLVGADGVDTRSFMVVTGELHRLIGLLAVALFLGSAPLVESRREQDGQFVQARLITRVPRESDADSVYLEQPVGATRFADGTIAVADGMAPAIRFFDADGGFTGTVGREGEGPGEFATLSWMGRCGERTATVWDFSLLRFTSIDDIGQIVEQRRLEDRFDVPRPPALLACSRTGHIALLLRLGGERIPGREISVLTAPLYIMSSAGVPTLLDGSAPVIEWINDERMYRPVSMTTHFAIFESHVYVARSDSPVIEAYDLGGRLEGTVTLDLVRRTPTDSHVRRNAEERTAFIADRASRARFVDQFMDLPRPDYLPYHNGIHLDPVGRLWVLISFPGDPTTALRAHTLSGEVVGEVRVPADLRVLEIGSDYVLGSIEDSGTLEPKVALYGFELEN
jgi:hypothetical protein